METIIVVALTVSTFATLCGIFMKTTRQMIRLLFFQAVVLGFVELSFCLINLIIGLEFEALVDFFATFAEWFSAAVIVALNLVLSVYVSHYLPGKINVLPFVVIMFSISVFIIATRTDPLKILVGLNMAKNALYPLFAESPLFIIPFILVLMIFVNLVGVFIVEAYRDYGAMSVKAWRLVE